MKRSILGTLAVVAAVLMMSLQSFAQPGGGPGGPGGPGGGRGPGGRQPGGPGGPGGGMGMMGNPLSNAKVQELLGLSAEQTEQLKKIQDEAREQMRNAPRPPRGENNARPTAEEMQKFRADFEKRIAETQQKVNKVLDAKQQATLKEVTFQLGGGLNSMMLNEKSLDVVNLTDDQKAKIQKLVADRDAENRAAMEKITDWRNMSQEDRTKMRTEGEARNKKFSDQVKDVLTAEQKAKAEKLTTDAPALREKLGMTRNRGGEGGNRGGEGNNGNRGGRGERGGDNYRPGAGSWRPGEATPEKKEGETAPATPNRRFPRTEN